MPDLYTFSQRKEWHILAIDVEKNTHTNENSIIILSPGIQI